MNRTFSKIIILVFIISSLAGCMPVTLIQQSNQNYKKSILTAQLPVGWAKIRNFDCLLHMSKDGLTLQNIFISRINIDKELPLTKRKITAQMLPHELAQLIIDETQLNKEFLNLTVLSNEPYTSLPVAAFLIEFKYTNNDFVPYHVKEIGFVQGNYYYQIRYEACEQHYYHDGIKDFDEFLKTLKVII
ncbi:MAG: hypothetical protein AB1650_04195 [Candidatus Omnitrophota bacterium]